VGAVSGLEPLPRGLADLQKEERDILLKVADVLRRIEFGTVVLTVQDGKVVQIEMAEKFRLR
jgi:hypothetical protein